MSKTEPKVYSRAFKLAAVRRLEAGEKVSALAQELGIARQLIDTWRDQMLSGGPEALRGKGRPHKVALGSVVLEPASAETRIAELERLVGRQQADLAFFQKALRYFEGQRPATDAPGVTVSTSSSEP